MRIKFTKFGNNHSGSLTFCDNDGKEIISIAEIERFKAVHGKDGTWIQIQVNELVPVEIEVAK